MENKLAQSCGRLLLVVLMPLGLGSVLACGLESAAVSQVANAAAAQFNCARDKIEVFDQQPITMRARGCGMQLTYMQYCAATSRAGVMKCSWVPVRDSSNLGAF